jgi:hypothetical protein
MVPWRCPPEPAPFLYLQAGPSGGGASSSRVAAEDVDMDTEAGPSGTAPAERPKVGPCLPFCPARTDHCGPPTHTTHTTAVQRTHRQHWKMMTWLADLYHGREWVVWVQVWRPGVDGMDEDEELQFDPTAYDCLHALSLEWPCLR